MYRIIIVLRIMVSYLRTGSRIYFAKKKRLNRNRRDG